MSSLDEDARVSLEMSLTDCILRMSEAVLRKVFGRGVMVAGSVSVRFLLGFGVAALEAAIELRIVELGLRESDGRGLGFEAD